MKKETKGIVGFMVVVIVILVSISIMPNFPVKEYINYKYAVEIYSNQTTFNVEIPFPLNREGYIKEILDNFVISEGASNIKINKSIQGISLSIEGINYIRLESKVIKEGNIPKGLNYNNLSMTDSRDFENVTAWFYSNNNSVKIAFKFTYEDGYHKGIFKMFWGAFGEWEYNGNLQEGWHQVELRGYDAIA